MSEQHCEGPSTIALCNDLVKALWANIADPTNITWRAVLAALKEIENERIHEADRNRANEGASKT